MLARGVSHDVEFHGTLLRAGKKAGLLFIAADRANCSNRLRNKGGRHRNGGVAATRHRRMRNKLTKMVNIFCFYDAQ